MEPSSPAPVPESLWDQLGPIEREKVIVDDLVLAIEHPQESRGLLDHPAVHRAYVQDEYMPYWTELWPASRMLAKVIRRETWTPGTTVVEIGCGLGLPGIVALSMGLSVTFTDYDGCALRFAAQNARLNGFTDFRCLQLDWRNPPEDLSASVILAADIVYETRHVAPILTCIKKILDPAGFCLLTDLDRLPAGFLAQALAEEGLKFTTSIVRAGEPSGRRLRGTLYRITR